MTYGLPDFASIDVSDSKQTREIAVLVEAVVALFEPRLRDVKAIAVDPEEHDVQRIKFIIEAKLRIDAGPEVSFETVVELASGHTSIKEREVGRE